MFGPDTQLMFDAVQMVGLAVALTGGAVFIAMKRSKSKASRKAIDSAANADLEANTDLEERVRVLERIATDKSIGLADEIEALRNENRQGSLN